VDTLEELTFPPAIQALVPLAPETTLGPDGRLTIVRHLEARGRVNRYLAWWHTGERSIAAEAREAPLDHPGLCREEEVLSASRFAMLPTYLGSFEHQERRYLVIEPVEGQTLEAALEQAMPLEAAISVVLQLAQAFRRLHRDGWAHVGLGPADVVLGQPVKIAHLGGAVRLGEVPPLATQIAGYSAPELAQPAAITGKEDVYTLGALLFRALTGQPLPETGAELTMLSSTVPVPGVPQLLARALAAADERLDLEQVYQQVLVLRQRLGRDVLQLEIASATTVGLNPTRVTNEDACGYVTRTLATQGDVAQHSLLVMADGMGGMEAGEVASGTALRMIVQAASRAGAGVPEEQAGPSLDPVALIRAAAPAVHAAGQGRQMGTTVTVVAVQDGQLTLGHVGDTRAYLFREQVLTQLTTDHSLVAAMVASGVLTRDEARGHPDSNKVLRSLGSQRELPDGYVDDLTSAYGQPSLALHAGDWLLLCSDGVWGTVEDDRIRDVLAEALDCPAAAGALVELALQAGAPDNASAVVARCVRAAWR
jgi:protein phosphatase